MKLTARNVRAMYDLFRTLPPYNRWKLPPAEKLRFAVTNSRKEYGRYEWWSGTSKRRIAISRHNVKSFHALAITMAHELIHVHQELSGTYSERSEHNRAFVKTAKHVCRALGFDSTGFV